jgi:Uma2 family endonuclease
MNQLARRPLPHMMAEEFLAWPGDGDGQRFQLVDGEVRPMSPASRIHGLIQANLAYLLVSAVRTAGLTLQVMTEAAIVPRLNASGNVRVPDLAVAPDDDVRGEQVVADPVLVIEILSPGNSDETRDNVRAYATLASVREIAVIHTSRMLAEVHRRDGTGSWQADPELVERGQRLQLAGIGLGCLLDEVYANTWLTRLKGGQPTG